MIRVLLTVGLIGLLSACDGGQMSPSVAGRAPAGVVPFREAKGGNFKVIYQFSSYQDGSKPIARLTTDAAGNLYGTTSSGGSSGYGTIFKINPQGQKTTVFTFDGTSLFGPVSDVIMDSKGNLYGVGGGGGGQPRPGSGGVFEIKTNGTEIVLHAFTGFKDGNFPFSDLIMDAEGNLYGTASEGGFFKGQCAPMQFGCGVVFKITPNGKYSVLHTFHFTDGSTPYAGVTMDAAGNLYGTTGFGGSSGWGTAFKLDTSGHETVLHNFTKGADGGEPRAGVVLDAQNNVYGTTQIGGFTGNQQCDSGCGVVFKVDPSGNQSVLHTFKSTPDGQFPFGTLVLSSSGMLYGTTQYGGKGYMGTAYQVATSGKQYRILHAFTGSGDGSQPLAGLTIDLQQRLDGVTEFGGNSGEGAVVFGITQKQPSVVHIRR